jgi:hypothetical protein
VSGDALNIDVRWPDGRRVMVHVSIEPMLGELAEPLERVDMDAVVVPIDDDELESKSRLLEFLAGITRHLEDRARISTVILEPNVGRLLDCLGISGPPPELIPVVLPDDG